MLGVGLLVLASALTFSLAAPVTTLAQDGAENGYVGARECRFCHLDVGRTHSDSAHDLALQQGAAGDSTEANFSIGEDLRQVQFPDESESSAFTAQDVAFIIGSGRHVQRFLYETGADTYFVLPAQWNVADEVWEPYLLADNWPDPAYEFGPNCAGCHTTGLDTGDYSWLDEGVQCEACHGPGLIHLEAADDAGSRPTEEEFQTIRSAIHRSIDPQICGQCHSQGSTPDNHLPYPVHYLPGDTLITETDFTLVSADDDAYWWETGHARQTNMQYNEWLESAHASALTTMMESEAADNACLVCHSGDYRAREARIALFADGTLEGEPPASLTLNTAEFGVTCVTCHNPHGTDELPSLLVSEPYALCTDCHSDNPSAPAIHHPVREMFEGLALVPGLEGIPGAHFTATEGPECATCHLSEVPVGSGSRASHTLSLVPPSSVDDAPPASCSGCHDTLTTTDLQYLIDDTQEAVRTRLTVTWARLATIEQPDTDTAEREDYDRIVTSLNFVQNDGSLGVHNYAYVDALLDKTERTLTELSVPGAVLVPTEAPAPTAIPAGSSSPSPSSSVTVSSGLRPMTVLLIGIISLILVIAGVAFFRRPDDREAGT